MTACEQMTAAYERGRMSRDAEVAQLLAALKLALTFVEAIYREHGRDYLPNSGDAQDSIASLLEKLGER